MLVE
jgi:hypothetical protein